jgi:4-hydroxy-tetrahydrodipicolinate reductase
LEVNGRSLPPGMCVGMRQVARATMRRREVVRITLEMGYGLSDPMDRIDIDSDPMVTAIIPGGIAGDTATAAVLVHSALAVRNVPAGLRSMPEIPIRPASTTSRGVG